MKIENISRFSSTQVFKPTNSHVFLSEKIPSKNVFRFSWTRSERRNESGLREEPQLTQGPLLALQLQTGKFSSRSSSESHDHDQNISLLYDVKISEYIQSISEVYPRYQNLSLLQDAKIAEYIPNIKYIRMYLCYTYRMPK